MTIASHGTPALTFTTLTAPEQLDEIRGDWERLLAQATEANTFLTPAWLLSWWEAYAPEARLQAVVARRGSELAGLAPLMRVREACLGIPLRCLRFMGDGTFETDHMGFVTDEAEAARVRAALLDAVLALPWDTAVLTNIPAASGLAAAIGDWCRAHGLLVDTKTTPCPVRRIPESFDALLASMPSRFRTALRSTRRKLAAAHRVEFGLHDDPREFDAALQSLFDNHESRWRARGQGGVFTNPRRRRFYALLTRALHERGALRFFYLRLDGRTVAQEYCFAHGRTVYLLQEGFDYSLAALNLGNALRSFVFEHLIESGYDAYDFLAGTSRHKQNWSDAAPDDVTFRIARPSLRGRWAHYAPRAVEGMKERLRPIRDRLGARGGEADSVQSPS